MASRETSVFEMQSQRDILFGPNPQGLEAAAAINFSTVDGQFNGEDIGLLRVIDTDDFGTSTYVSSVVAGVSSNGGRTYGLQRKPLLHMHMPGMEHALGMGPEDPHGFIVGDELAITYNAARLAPGMKRPHVEIGLATTKSLDEEPTVHGRIIGTAPDNEDIRFKAADGIVMESGRIMLAFTMATESSLGSIMAWHFSDLDELKKGLSKEQVGELLYDYHKHALWVPTGERIRRGPEVASPFVKTEHGYLALISREDSDPEPTWEPAAILTDLDDPQKVIGYMELKVANEIPPELLPEDCQVEVVQNVRFPSGLKIIVDPATGKKQIVMHYGRNDKFTTSALADYEEFMKALKSSEPPERTWPR